ncbi:MAG TPA: tripartite tricarboxylate transporter substrate-binding protein [Usitatibacter sp.]|jgi:tripartite-type tricarboxylate transporter receptor subunit TctC|nr:tripartite tricarboxylate transporter substrate-binding protein [Usitatibacter sp.]
MMRVVVLLSLLAASAMATAQGPAYPDKPVKIIVGFPAGGPTDLVARMFGQRATDAMHQPFVVENKPGANSIIAAEAVASAAPDGYTILMAAQNHAMIPALYADRIKFDPAKSFAAICIVAKSPTVLVVAPKMGVKTLAEFLEKVRQKPGAYTYASVGVGSAVHLATANLLQVTKTSMTHVPYKGAAPASTALLSGEVDAYLATVGSVLAQIKAGKMVPLAVAAPERSRLVPDVPTFAEQGVARFNAEVWYGLLAPAATPEKVVSALEREADAMAKDPSAQDRLVAAGIEPVSVCGAAFATELTNEVETYKRVAKALNLKVE